ncbi:MAG: hypothetical protein ACFFDN_29660, partial [Candidatus Hodarchaeota archaeon]
MNDTKSTESFMGLPSLSLIIHRIYQALWNFKIRKASVGSIGSDALFVIIFSSYSLVKESV